VRHLLFLSLSLLVLDFADAETQETDCPSHGALQLSLSCDSGSVSTAHVSLAGSSPAAED